VVETEVTKLQSPTEGGPLGVPVLSWTDDHGPHRARVESRGTLGSATENLVVVADRTVSRLHLELEIRDDRILWVRDLGSRNGTYLEGARVEIAGLVKNGTLRVGSIAIQVEYEARPAAAVLWPEARFGPIVGQSIVMRALFASLARIAPSEAPVLIQGETGTGKELVARALHDASPRRKGPFVVVDCAAIPETLLDSELFGHAKGSFTGALAAHVGAIESANHGTVFLDEIGELPLAVQPKLLRVLEAHTVRRVGETEHRQVDVRFISATHRDLLTMVSAGHFREDLYFRLAVLPVAVPPLRKRQADIEVLVRHFLPPGRTVSQHMLREAERRAWRGNVRELRNFVERAIALGEADALSLTPGDSVPSLSVPPPSPEVGETPADILGVSFTQGFKTFRDAWLDAGEREYIRGLLRRQRNVAEAAREAGVDRTYLYRLVRKHGLNQGDPDE